MTEPRRPDGLTAVVVRDPRHADAEIERIASIRTAVRGTGTRVAALDSPMLTLGPDRTVVGSLFGLSDYEHAFGLIVLGRQVRTFKTPWARGLYWFLNELVEPGGELVLPVYGDAAAEREHGWRAADLDEMFGSAGEPIADRWLAFTVSGPLPIPPSVFPWAVRDFTGTVHERVLARASTRALSALLHAPPADEVVVAGLDAVRDQPQPVGEVFRADSGASPFTADLARMTRSVSYLLSGVSSKAAATKHAIQTYGQPGPQAVVDIGGATGLLAAELLLDDELDVRHGLVIELDATSIPAALRMCRGLATELSGRLHFAIVPAQDYAFARPATAITMMSSLLLVPFQERRAVLDRCWEVLEPGGVFVVYEVLKAVPPMALDAVQYTAVTVDAELSRYGPIIRLDATTLNEITADEAGEASVFRVVSKR